jgi:hypothetical protein
MYLLAHIIAGHGRMTGIVNLVGDVARQLFACREQRRFARAELFALHLVRLEIIADVVAHPELVALLDAHMAVSHRLARVAVHRRAVRRQHYRTVTDADAVRAEGGVGRKVEFNVADRRFRDELMQRPDFPRRFVLRPGCQRKNRAQKCERGDGGKFFHQARPIKQNELPLPRVLTIKTPLERKKNFNHG